MRGDSSESQRALPWDDILQWMLVEVRVAARHYRLPDEERDELRQQVSLRVLRSLAEFDPDAGAASLETWVRRQAGWGVADYWRARLRRERHETAYATEAGGRSDGDESTSSPVHAAYRRELRDALRACLEKLTPAQRDRFLEAEKSLGAARTLPVIARGLGISRDALKDSLKRARELMRRCLRASGFEPAFQISHPPDPSGRAVSRSR